MKAIRALAALVGLLSFPVIASGQQNAGCQTQDLVNLGQKIASFRATVQSKGFTSEQVDSLVQGYQDTLLNSMATACNPRTGQQASVSATLPGATQTAQASQQTPQDASPKVVKTKIANGKQETATVAQTTVAPNRSTEHPSPQTQATPSQPHPDGNTNAVTEVDTPTEDTPASTGTACANIASSIKNPDITLDYIYQNSQAAVSGKSTTKVGPVQICVLNDPKAKVQTYVALGNPEIVDNITGAFSVTSTTPIVADAVIVAQSVTTDKASGKSIFTQSSDPEIVIDSCSEDAKGATGTKPTLYSTAQGSNSPILPGTNVTIAGLAPPGTEDQVRICVNDRPFGTSVAVDSNFQFSKGGVTLALGDSVVAQTISAATPFRYGTLSNEVAVSSCKDSGDGDAASRPKITVSLAGGGSIQGTVASNADFPVTAVRVCVDEQPVGTVAVENGSFSYPYPLKSGSRVTAASVATDPRTGKTTYGVESDKQKVGYLYSDRFWGSYIGGVEQSGYSSQITNTNAFVSAYMHSSFMQPPKFLATAIWGRVRLLSAPQPSTQYIVSVIADPTGQISQTNWSQVGAVVDYSIGPEFRLHQWDNLDGQASRISFILGVGESTPLTANTALQTYLSPVGNTPDCTNLLSNPLYKPYLTMYPTGAITPTPSPLPCIWNPLSKTPYTYITFTAQDRSNFLLKYGGGFRITHIYPAKSQGSYPYSGMLDLTFGQDETITGGALHGSVFKMDGQTPFPFGNLSFIYFFGSASIRLHSDQTFPSIVLATPPTGTAVPGIPNPTVAVVPVGQPTRDFYRIGVGLNILDIFSKLKAGPSTTPSSAPATATPKSGSTPTPAANKKT